MGVPTLGYILVQDILEWQMGIAQGKGLVVIATRSIKPGTPFKSSIFRDEMKRAAETIRKDALADFKKTTGNWRHKPKFASRVIVGGIAQGIQIQVGTDDKIWHYLDDGTKVRYATMSADWQSKTEPDVVGSFPGKGKVLFINKKRARPGIKARHFTKHISKTVEKELQRETKNALARFARRSGHSI